MADDIAQALSNLDLEDDQLEAIKSIIERQQQASAAELAAKETKLRVNTDDELANKYPRIVNALRKGVEELPEGVELDAWMEMQESKLEALGVPSPTATQEPQPQPPVPGGWGSPLAPSASPPPGAEDALREAMNSGNTEAIVRNIHSLHEMGMKDKVRSVTNEYQDVRPIISTR